jgi:hypothetical protein
MAGSALHTRNGRPALASIPEFAEVVPETGRHNDTEKPARRASQHGKWLFARLQAAVGRKSASFPARRGI